MRKILILFVLIAAYLFAWVLWERYTAPSVPTSPTTHETIPVVGSIDRILIEKSSRRMTLIQNGNTVRSYTIALGFAPQGTKVKEGDGKTPEGIFKINRRNEHSKFTLSLGLDYPRPADTERARKGGYSAGGDIFIHGQPNGLLSTLKLSGDWTAGCIALSNQEIQELWQIIPIGTTIEIRP